MAQGVELKLQIRPAAMPQAKELTGLRDFAGRPATARSMPEQKLACPGQPYPGFRRQAQILEFNDAFVLAGILAFCAVPMHLS